MKFAKVFADRPIFATVLSILIVLVGTISYFNLPVSQYPEITPPTIQVSAFYPGADAETVAKTVATPIEQAVNGVENMLYMSSQSTNDGAMALTITFELGTDLEDAQVLVQNRVATVEPRLPEEVRRLGVTTVKNSPDLMMVIHLYSPDSTYDALYISNYATLNIKDQLSRIEGVGSLMVFGGSDYAMRIWLDPDRIAAVNMTPAEVVGALREQNVQVAGGILNQQPQPDPGPFEFSIQTQGRFNTVEQFENIVVKSDGGRLVRVRDVARVEMGAQTYATRSYLGKNEAVAMVIFQRPGTNALEMAEELQASMENFSKSFPEGLVYDIIYNPTKYVEDSINEVYTTLFEAVLLVVLVVVLFLQSMRTSIIPIVAIPVSLIGTFAVLSLLGFSLNTLTLFGLVLAIGIVVDDAIVVVENVERNLAMGMPPKQAVYKTMDEVGLALIAMALVLVAVFLPTAFISGISGQFYKQFAITIAVSTMISAFVSLTLSPALAALFLKAHDPTRKVSLWKRPLQAFFRLFDRGLEALTRTYGRILKGLLKISAIALLVYAGLLWLTYDQFQRVPSNFIPEQDQGYFIAAVQLPPGSSLERTDAVIREAVDRFLEVPGVKNTVGFGGFSGATFTSASNAGAIFVPLKSFAERDELGVDYHQLQMQLQMSVASIQEAMIFVIAPPPVRGIGNNGGWKMMVQDRSGRGLDELLQYTWMLAGAGNQDPAVTQAFTLFENQTPQKYLNIDRERALKLGIDIQQLNQTLEIFLGSAYVNDFNFLGRTFRVTAQADAPYRLSEDDILDIRIRSRYGQMVPFGTVATISDRAGPSRVPRYNLYPAIGLQGSATPGTSMGEAMRVMEEKAAQVLPEGIGYEWTDLAFQTKEAGNTAVLTFVLAVVFVFLLLAAQYESWLLPLAVILIVPMSLLSAITGVSLSGNDNNIITQIGLVVLIGLASKNAILIVEFARQKQDEGLDRVTAALEAARLRLRPILMTSFSFILGVLPLVFASGAGSEMRRVMGITVFSGMLGVTIFGLLLTPVFYATTQKLAELRPSKKKEKQAQPQVGGQA